MRAMDGPVWDILRGIAWAATAGLLAGAGLLAFGGPAQAWSAVGLGAAAAVVLSVMAARSRTPGGASILNQNATDMQAPSPLVREIFERLPDPLVLLDSSGRVMFANTAMRGIIGVAPERKHISSLLRMPPILEAIRRTAASGESTSVEFSIPVPVQRHYQAYAARIGADPSVTILLLHDLTAMKRAEQMRADFVANASHELRTPLAALTGFIDTLKGHAKDDLPAREQFLGIMTVEAERMRRLIDDLLSLTRIEQNEHVPPSGEVSLESILREAVAALTPLAGADAMTLEISAAKNLPQAVGERDELIQIFQNLIHNAIKYGRQGGHVWITLSQGFIPGGRGADLMLIVAVRDDGEGIPSDSVPRLTERFYRVDVKRSREKGGTGLGLAIVKHIVNRHQGKLVIESKAGVGSTFTVYLPAVRRKDRTAPLPGPAPNPASVT
jgi:two-component system, OmpR family, phosphate regulon sensor histidine kinase PhoR